MRLPILSPFYSPKWFKMMLSNISYLSKLKPDKKTIIIKSALRGVTVWVYRTYSRIYVLEITYHDEQISTGFVPVFSCSAEDLKQSTLTVWPRRHCSNWKNRKYINTRSNDVTIVQKIMNELLKLEYRLYIYKVWLKHKKII